MRAWALSSIPTLGIDLDDHYLPSFVQFDPLVTALVTFSPWVTLYDRVLSQDPIHGWGRTLTAPCHVQNVPVSWTVLLSTTRSIPATDCSALIMPSTSQPTDILAMSLWIVSKYAHTRPDDRSRSYFSWVHSQNSGIDLYSLQFSCHMLCSFSNCNERYLQKAVSHGASDLGPL